MRLLEVDDNPNYPVGAMYSKEMYGVVRYKLVNVPCLEDLGDYDLEYAVAASIARVANTLQRSLREEGAWTGSGAAPQVKEFVRKAVATAESYKG